MASFDFRARAAQREQKAKAEREKEAAAERKRNECAAILDGAFAEHAQEVLGHSIVRTMRNGSHVTFTIGSRVIEVTVVSPTKFSVSQSQIVPMGVEAQTTGPVEITGEDGLMDALDAWARGQ